MIGHVTVEPALNIAASLGTFINDDGVHAARIASGHAEATAESHGTMLLADFREYFEEECVDQVSSNTVREHLIDLEWRPLARHARRQRDIETKDSELAATLRYPASPMERGDFDPARLSTPRRYRCL